MSFVFRYNLKFEIFPTQGKITVKVWLGSGEQKELRVKPSTLIASIAQAIAPFLGPSHSDNVRLEYCGEPLFPELRVADYEIDDGDMIDVVLRQLGGKPVIYLFSPTERNVSVTLSLIPEWTISVLYPVVPKCPLGKVQWKVKTHADGTLTETSSGLNIAYLFWEAQ